MLTVAFLANQYPSATESYVADQIRELRSRGVRVVAGSVRRSEEEDAGLRSPAEVVLLPLRATVAARAAWLCVRRWKRIAPLLRRILLRGEEGSCQRVKALAHTFLGACYAGLLEGRDVEYIHVHHGYFGSWIAMTAAQLLSVPFGLTLHGSDLLVHGTYLDTKLENCALCLTVSEFNQRYILERYPQVDPAKVVVSRLGVDLPGPSTAHKKQTKSAGSHLVLVAVGRLHPVKDHAFLVRACAELRRRGVGFQCYIAGDGPERRALETQIQDQSLGEQVHLLGHLPPDERDAWYDKADVVVITSRSEGIPVVLMEAMSRGTLVLAPAITGIPELVIPGRTGFLYQQGAIDDFVEHLIAIQLRMRASREDDRPAAPFFTAGTLDLIRHRARLHVQENFNRTRNLELFADSLLQRVATQVESIPDENFVLQQI